MNSGARGRPRDPRTDEAIFAATVEIITKQGIDAATIGAVAEVSGISRPTIYRRFQNKRALLEHCVEHITTHALPAPPPADNPREEVINLMFNTIQMLKHTPVGGLFRAVIPHLQDDPELASMTNSIGKSRRLRFEKALKAAQREGIIPAQRDLSLLGDALLGAIYFRFLMTRRSLDKRYAARLFNELIDQ